MNKVARVQRSAARWLAALLVSAFLVRHLSGEMSAAGLLLGLVPDLVWVGLVLSAGWLWRSGQPRRARAWVIAGIAALAFLEPGLPGLPTESSTSLSVLQLNMQHGLGGQDRIANLILEREPDIIFLQETGPLDMLVPKGPLVNALADYRLSNATVMPLTGQLRSSLFEEISCGRSTTIWPSYQVSRRLGVSTSRRSKRWFEDTA